MAITDYRYDPFLDVINVQAITNEEHTIPTSSPYTIRLSEVPNKANPSTMTVKDSDGNIFTEVSAQPGQGQFWPDYSVSYGDDWNTGTLLFNAADAGKTVLVTYNGMGTLTDERIPDQMELEGGSEQPEIYVGISGASVFDVVEETGTGRYSTTYTYRMYQHPAISTGIYTLRNILQQLMNASHTHSTYELITHNSNCSSDCSCGGG